MERNENIELIIKAACKIQEQKFSDVAENRTNKREVIRTKYFAIQYILDNYKIYSYKQIAYNFRHANHTIINYAKNKISGEYGLYDEYLIFKKIMDSVFIANSSLNQIQILVNFFSEKKINKSDIVAAIQRKRLYAVLKIL